MLKWAALAIVLISPIVLAARSPLLAWRDPIYIVGGFAGVIAIALILIQPLLIAGYLPGLLAKHRRRAHRVVGAFLFCAVVLHVVALWITSPPDVVDALLFSSPTPFSAWGVIAMWSVFATSILAIFRKQMRPHIWRGWHTAFAAVIVFGTIVHVILIEGTMESISKAAICILVLVVTAKAFIDLRVWRRRKNR